ncbi:replication/maintenance protein RepL [Sulfurimonas sp. SWIR-19]|uniref:replication/maintenance protein RepL n=1 Tax=Sulfurimonas sp. SWIR-19 TaxID=2878390 RepID=UPI001CF2F008|nr:replication/maintenance protein RepL [Sulfurimonas sp. SWIR-19]UCN01158.1 replication/maintenance protein RepL [Sulfurimonas sp. SWIR-19]
MAFVEVRTLNEEGEIVTSQQARQYKAEAEPNYIKLYLEDISYLHNLPAKAGDILFELLHYVDYNHEIYLSAGRRKKVAENLGKSEKHIKNTITKLIQAEILLKVERGVYQLNSYLFGKGSWKDILKHRNSLQLNIFYSHENGREIKQS